MSLWAKIKSFVTGNAHDALDSMQDVGTESRQIVREMDEKLKEAESGLLTAQSRLFILQDDIEKATKEVNKWNASAVEAASKGKQDLAMQCVQKAKQAQLIVDGFSVEMESLNESIDVLQRQIDEAYKDRGTVATDLVVMETKIHVANATAQAATAVSDLNSANTSSRVGAIRKKAQESSAMSRAIVERNQTRQGTNLDRQLRELNQSSDQEYLDSLMQLNAIKPTEEKTETVEPEKKKFSPRAAEDTPQVTHTHNHYHYDSAHTTVYGSSGSTSSSSDCSSSSSSGSSFSGCD